MYIYLQKLSGGFAELLDHGLVLSFSSNLFCFKFYLNNISPGTNTDYGGKIFTLFILELVKDLHLKFEKYFYSSISYIFNQFYLNNKITLLYVWYLQYNKKY